MTENTNIQKHEERAHALLSASCASRWLNCTPSARLEDEYGKDKGSVYAKSGTLAHELAELYLRKDTLENISSEDFEARLEEIMSDELFNEEMLDFVSIYTDYCSSQLSEALTENKLAAMEIEQKLDLSRYVPDSFGTADCIIINDNTIEVIDLKYGMGVPVYATWNRQLMLYGLGALQKYDTMYDITEIKLTIVQPRIDNISSWQISVADLVDWAEKELKEKAQLAYQGKGELNAGDWCRFCAVRNRCRKLYEQQLEIAKYEFAKPKLLSDEEIADVIKKAPDLIEWMDSVFDYANKLAIEENKQWPGLKLVESRSIRKWINEDDAAKTILSSIPGLSEEDIFTTKLKTITNIEKLVGKKLFEAKLSNIVIKPQGKPTLVPEDDKRPAIGYQQAKIDFKD